MLQIGVFYFCLRFVSPIKKHPQKVRKAAKNKNVAGKYNLMFFAAKLYAHFVHSPEYGSKT